MRKICDHCKKPVKYDRETLEESGIDYEKYRDFTFYEGEGCSECHGVGFHGRSAIVELLALNDELRELIMARAPISQLKKVAHVTGTHFLRESALEKVFLGISSLREINRVTFVEKV